jgi:hypothetical protein
MIAEGRSAFDPILSLDVCGGIPNFSGQSL